MYDPSTGRWLTEDPLGFEGNDANLYRYVGNDPTTETDPTGLIASYMEDGRKVDVDAAFIAGLDLGKYRMPTAKHLKDIGADVTPAQFEGQVREILNAMKADEADIFACDSKKQLVNYATLNEWVVVYAKVLQKAELGFPRGKAVTECPSSKYWEPSDKIKFIEARTGKEATATGVVLKKGVTPADAYRSFLGPFPLDDKKQPIKPIVDCATFVTLAYRLALLEVLGEEDFNKTFQNIPLAGGQARPYPYEFTQGFKHLIPGMTTPLEFPPWVNAGNYQQENTISIGNKMLVAHPFGEPLSARDLAEKLQKRVRAEGIYNPFNAGLRPTQLPK